MSISMIGLDTAKFVLRIDAVNHSGEIAPQRKLRRSELISFFDKPGACTVVMEA